MAELIREGDPCFGLNLEEPPLDYVITIPCEEGDSKPDRMLMKSADEVFDDSGGSGKPTEAGLVSDKPTDTPDNLGYPKVCGEPYGPGSNDPWIALVQRGGCQFVNKVREAQRLGAKAVVVGGDNPDLYGNPDTLVNMYSPGAYIFSLLVAFRMAELFSEDVLDVKIATTFIRYSDYIELYSLIGTSNTFHNGLKTLSPLLSTETSAWEWYS